MWWEEVPVSAAHPRAMLVTPRLEHFQMARQPGLDGRHRDRDGHIDRKRSDTLVKTLRKTYGSDFLEGFRSDTTLGTVLKKTGAESLRELVKKRGRS